MRLTDALALRRDLCRRNPTVAYYVRRSAIRSPAIGPFCVAIRKPPARAGAADRR